MAFGFPAYHEALITEIPPGVDIGLSLMNTLRELGWGPSFDPNGITASTAASGKGFGEKIIVTLSDSKPTKIRSECAVPTMCMDGGRNERNVKQILDKLPNHYVRG